MKLTTLTKLTTKTYFFINKTCNQIFLFFKIIRNANML